jgi:phosphohistidine phosphatase
VLLYIMRHGIATLRGDPAYPDDADRPLTEDGRKKTRAIAKGLKSLRLVPQVIWTSPYQRAAQTATLVAELFDLPRFCVRETEHLEPGGSVEGVLAELAQAHPNQAVMVVGHEPDLSGLASFLLTGDSEAVPIDLKKGAVLVLETTGMPSAGKGVLKGLYQPVQLRAASRAKAGQ